MTDGDSLRILGIMVVAAGAFALIARKLRVPTIVGYLSAGVLLSPLLTLMGDGEDPVQIISRAGIILLLFLVGLELDLSRIGELGHRAFLIAALQMGLTFTAGTLLSLLLGFGWQTAPILGAALTFSSTVVAVKVLTERKETLSLHGKIAIAVLLFQDFAAILLLTLMAGFDTESALSLSGILGRMTLVLGGMVLLVLFSLLAGRHLLSPLLTWAAPRPAMLFLWSLCWCFLLVQVAHSFHLSHEIGAFLAGVSLSRLPFSHELSRRVNPLMHFFIAVFFTTMGLDIDLKLGGGTWMAVGALSLFALAGKFLIVLLAARTAGIGGRAAFRSATLLAQISEFSLILIALAEDKGLVDGTETGLVGLVGLITISLSAWGIQHRERLHRMLLAPLGFLMAGGTEETARAPSPLEGHVIVVGMNTLGISIANRLVDRNLTVLAIDTSPGHLAYQRCRTLLGDAADRTVLDEARLSRALLLVSALHIEDVNNFLAWHCRQLGVPCAIHAVEFTETSLLMDLDITYLMLPKVDGVKLQERKLRDMGILEA